MWLEGTILSSKHTLKYPFFLINEEKNGIEWTVQNEKKEKKIDSLNAPCSRVNADSMDFCLIP